ncbi:unnamed protein product [Rotaria sp. Silwood1]|nr:unnamed protein product [Rotaria sp. Silwood1]
MFGKTRYENKDNTICTCLVSDNQQLLLDMFALLTFDFDFGNLKQLSKSATSSITGDKSELSDLGIALSIWLNAFKRVTVNGMPLFINYYLLKLDKNISECFKNS